MELFDIERYEYYKIEEDGSLVTLDGFDEKTNEVYVVVDNDERLIFLWKGLTAGVRQKFIGSRATGDKRKELGYHYRIEVMDEDDETAAFVTNIRGGEVSSDKPVPGTITSVDDAPEFSSYAEAAAAQGISISDDEVKATTDMPGGAPSKISRMGGIGARPQRSFLSDPSFFEDVKTDKETRQKVTSSLQAISKDEALELINALGAPNGFDREMLIVGNSVYRVEVEGENQYDLVDLDNPLDGVIMVSQYRARLLCENGKVKAVELLKQTSEDFEVDESLTQDLEDLTAMFQIEIE